MKNDNEVILVSSDPSSIKLEADEFISLIKVDPGFMEVSAMNLSSQTQIDFESLEAITSTKFIADLKTS